MVIQLQTFENWNIWIQDTSGIRIPTFSSFPSSAQKKMGPPKNVSKLQDRKWKNRKLANMPKTKDIKNKNLTCFVINLSMNNWWSKNVVKHLVMIQTFHERKFHCSQTMKQNAKAPPTNLKNVKIIKAMAGSE